MNFTGSKAEKPQASGMTFPSVEKFMASDEVTLTPELTIDEAINTILENKLTGAPVLDHNRAIVGMLTEKDCLRLIVDAAYNNLPHHDKTVSDYMSKVVKTVSTDHDILDVANEFLTTHYRKFPVVHNGKLVGQVSRRDILKAMRETKITTW
ncbi:CBS domain-containing protein [Catalinimonas alkaloidigena]|uniref:CBS domain-containing protein n=1 Tax=Catalinimonas alkaloidigena TaxID=1075417 RepID=UPI002406FEA0|nr:CBS domain-containing protein [Catalinimonas alkaloidigena]MDF9796207.1 CBS domain-containing protein [Catalinimonas alkaloidigena]